MRLVTLVLIALLAAIQYPLWFGKGGWIHVRDLRDQLATEEQKNAQLKERNERLAGEVQDLKDGTNAIEERARYELGMVKDGEVFVQLLGPQSVSAPVVSSAAAAPEVVAAVPAATPAPSQAKTAAHHAHHPRHEASSGKRHHHY